MSYDFQPHDKRDAYARRRRPAIVRLERRSPLDARGEAIPHRMPRWRVVVWLDTGTRRKPVSYEDRDGTFAGALSEYRRSRARRS